MPDGQVLEFSRVTKNFGTVVAVSDLSARIEPGAVTGFLGPNGAGKTTSLRILLGQIRPSSGTATIGGVAYSDLRHPLRTIGAVLEDVAYRPRRTAVRQLTMAAKANSIPLSRVDEVIRLVGLGDDAETRIGTYSLGMRQRLSIANALLGDPGALVLDEPANGLDPAGIRWMRLLMRRLADEGRTVLVSSHVLSEIEQVADNVLVISKGRLVYSDGIEHLVDPSSAAVIVDAEDRSGLAAALRAAGVEMELLRSGLTVRGSDAATVGAIAASAGVALTTLQQRGPTLEDVFLQLVNEGRLVRTQTMATPVQHAPALDEPVAASDALQESAGAAAAEETDAAEAADATDVSEVASAAPVDEDADLAEDDAVAAAELGLAVPASAVAAGVGLAGIVGAVDALDTDTARADDTTDADSPEPSDQPDTAAAENEAVADTAHAPEAEAEVPDAPEQAADAGADVDFDAQADEPQGEDAEPEQAETPTEYEQRHDESEGADAESTEDAPIAEPSFDDLISGVALPTPAAASGFGTSVLLDAWNAKEEEHDDDIVADETPIAGITLDLSKMFGATTEDETPAEETPAEETSSEETPSEEAPSEAADDEQPTEEAADAPVVDVAEDALADEAAVDESFVTEASDTVDTTEATPLSDDVVHANVALTAPVVVEGHEGFDGPVLDDEPVAAESDDNATKNDEHAAPVAAPRVTHEPSDETGEVKGIEVFDTLGVDILHLDEDGNIQDVTPSPRALADADDAHDPDSDEASDVDADDDTDDEPQGDPRAAAMSASLAAAARAYFEGDDSDAPSYTPGPATPEEALAANAAFAEDVRTWAVASTGVIDTVPLSAGADDAETNDEAPVTNDADDAADDAGAADSTPESDDDSPHAERRWL